MVPISSTKTLDMSVSRSNPSISAETDFGAARAGSCPPGRRSFTGFAQRKKRIGGGGANGIEGPPSFGPRTHFVIVNLST